MTLWGYKKAYNATELLKDFDPLLTYDVFSK
jgi:hypothetical protein